jgi:hypothetical protein
MMVELDTYFSVWKTYLKVVKKAAARIDYLEEKSRFMQALLVRNSCLDFLAELELGFDAVMRGYILRQEEMYLSEQDAYRMLGFHKPGWSISSAYDQKTRESCKELKVLVNKMANQAADFELSLIRLRSAYEIEVHKIIGALAVKYGISPRVRKRR